MTGDPAVDAACRAAFDGHLSNGLTIPRISMHEFGVSAAREALAPIRAVLDQLDAFLASDPRPYYVDRTDAHFDAIDDIRALVYTTEELEAPMTDESYRLLSALMRARLVAKMFAAEPHRGVPDCLHCAGQALDRALDTDDQKED